MEQLLHSELDEAGEESHYSVAETVPSEGDSGAGTQDVSENEEEVCIISSYLILMIFKLT